MANACERFNQAQRRRRVVTISVDHFSTDYSTSMIGGMGWSEQCPQRPMTNAPTVSSTVE
jgi:hypothetical protein